MTTRARPRAALLRTAARARRRLPRAIAHGPFAAFFTPRFARFAIVGFSGALVDMGLLWFFGEALLWPLGAAKLGSGELALLNNFFWNDRWTFRDEANSEPGSGGRWRRLAR